MFDIGWTEMLVISVIAILVVGPKDLPAMLRTVGQFVGKAKRMAREFQTQFDDAVRDSDLDEVRKSFEDLKSANPTGEIGKALSPLTEAADDLKSAVEKSDLNATKPKKATDTAEQIKAAGENSISDGAKRPTSSKGDSPGKRSKPAGSTAAKKSPPAGKTAAPAKRKSKARKTSSKKTEPAKKAAIANG